MLSDFVTFPFVPVVLKLSPFTPIFFRFSVATPVLLRVGLPYVNLKVVKLRFSKRGLIPGRVSAVWWGIEMKSRRDREGVKKSEREKQYEEMILATQCTLGLDGGDGLQNSR